MEASELEKKISRQVEFYFGDINLPKDKFLRDLIKLDDGWVPMSTMLRFNKLASYSKDKQVIVEALKKSSNGFIEVHESGDKIRRSPHIPIPGIDVNRQRDLKSRSVLLIGLPLDSKRDDLIEFFDEYDGFEHLLLRNLQHAQGGRWTFTGIAAIVFKSSAHADKFLKLDDLKYKGKSFTRKLLSSASTIETSWCMALAPFKLY